jgi:predicted metal-dependent phosphoesterase TrpH
VEAKGFCDLHAHTTASDGDLTPTELVKLAVDSELDALGVTDHDTVGGIAEALSAAEAAGLALAPGVEISAEFTRGTLHMLGYFVDHEHPALLEALEGMRGGRDVRNGKIVEKLNELGLAISMEEVLRIAGGDSVSRNHIAQVLLDKGYCADRQEVFDEYLAKGAAAYFDRLRLGPRESIELIRSAGGLPILAHPYQTKLGDDELENLVEELVGYGLAGIECYYSVHTPEQTAFYLSLAKRYDLLVTGGSDYHGVSKPDVELGIGCGELEVPIELFEKLKKAAKL